MEKFFNIFTATNGIIAFYFILTSLRQLAYAENGDIASPLFTGIFFLSVVLVSQLLRKIAGQFFGTSDVSQNQPRSEYESSLTRVGLKK